MLNCIFGFALGENEKLRRQIQFCFHTWTNDSTSIEFVSLIAFKFNPAAVSSPITILISDII